MGVNNKDFAAMRGVDPSRVSQWKRQGRLILDADGKIDAAATNAALNASLDQVKGARRAGNVTSISPAPNGGNVQERGLDLQGERQADGGDRGQAPKADSGYWANKTKRERAEATLAEMRALREAGALTSVAAVRKEASETARRLRNAMFAIPDRSATVLASMSSPAEIHKYLTSEIHKALRELSTELEQRAAAAARADEPNAAVV
jgi:phage terminase Nu1 subunit (DNA packaging protein)